MTSMSLQAWIIPCPPLLVLFTHPGSFLTSLLAQVFLPLSFCPFEVSPSVTLFPDLFKGEQLGCHQSTNVILELFGSPRGFGPPYSTRIFLSHKFALVLCPSPSSGFELLLGRAKMCFVSNPLGLT